MEGLPDLGGEDEAEDKESESDEEEVLLTDGQKYFLEARVHMHAHGVGQSIDNALHYYNTSIGMGEPKAMLAMADYNETGFNMRINPAKAEEYLQQAADAGEPEAQVRLAKKIIEGRLLSIDKLLAAERSPAAVPNGSPLSAKISSSGNLGASLSHSHLER